MTQNEIIEIAKQAKILQPEAVLTYLESFANLVAQLERERIATSIERLPFGDTAASFAIYVRELKDDTK